MSDDYDFSKGHRGPVIRASSGKTRITIRVDDDVLQWFRDEVDRAGGGSYQSLINAVLREHVGRQAETLEDMVRRARGPRGAAPRSLVVDETRAG